MLASASEDQSVALLDFKTGKKLYTGKTSDNSNFLSSNNYFIILRFRYVCVLHLRKNKVNYDIKERHKGASRKEILEKSCRELLPRAYPILLYITEFHNAFFQSIRKQN